MLVAGTDSSIPGLVPGFALHDELEALVDTGLTNWQALVAATIAPARWLGTDSDLGTVEAGKVADLVLLDANPLDNIANTRRIAAVILHGQLSPKAELDRRMALLGHFEGNPLVVDTVGFKTGPLSMVDEFVKPHRVPQTKSSLAEHWRLRAKSL